MHSSITARYGNSNGGNLKKLPISIETIKNQHLIHFLFKDFALGYTPIVREVVCILASAGALIVLPLLTLIAAYFYEPSAQFPQMSLLAKMAIFTGFAILFAIAMRLYAFLFFRLKAPYDWLIAPSPVFLTLVFFLWTYFQQFVWNRPTLKIPQNIIVVSTFPAIFGAVLGILFAVLIFACYDLSQRKREALAGAL